MHTANMNTDTLLLMASKPRARQADPWTSIRTRQSTVQKLSDYKINDRESLETVIKRAIGTHEKVQELKRRRAAEAHATSK